MLLLVVAVATAGCLKRASWMPNDHGGYTLYTDAMTMDQAITRFQRSGDDLCHGTRYALSTPVVKDRGWRFSAGGGGAFGGTTMTVESELACDGRGVR
jgi:hypothetical protein